MNKEKDFSALWHALKIKYGLFYIKEFPSDKGICTLEEIMIKLEKTFRGFTIS